MSINLEYWTDFADGAVMFPLGLAVPIVLAIIGQRRAALTWTMTIGCVWAAMLVLKLGGYTIDALAPESVFSEIDLVTPSGHVASAAAIYGGLAGLLLSRPGTLMGRTVLAAILVAAVIGATRVLLGAHSSSEVIVGAAVGIAGAATLASAARTALDHRARLPVVAAALLVIMVFHGDNLTWEDSIHNAALRTTRVWKSGR